MKDNNEPLYLQVKHTLIREIETGEYKNQEMLPSEKELGVKYGVSRVTIRKALDLLKKENLLYSKAGFGTAINHFRSDLKKFTSIKSFTSEMNESGTKVETITSTLAIIFADDKLVSLFSCDFSTKIYNLKRTRGYQNKPVVFSDTLLNLKQIELPTSKEFLFGSLYDYLISKDVLFSRFEEEIEAMIPSSELRSILNLEKDSVILKRIRRGFDIQDHLIEYTISYYDSKYYKYYIQINSNEK